MKNHIVGILIAVVTCLLPGSNIQSQVTTFAKSFGGPKYDAAFSVEPLRGGGFILVGTTYTLTSAANNVFAVRTDCAGDTLWTRAIGGSDNEAGLSVCETFDGGFAVAGTKATLHSDTVSVYILKLDSMGGLQWSKTLRLSARDCAYSICETRDSGLAIAGVMGSGPRGRSDAWFIKTNHLGDTLWTKTFGGDGDDGLRTVRPLPDNGFILCGYTNSFGPGSLDQYVIRLDSVGNTLWTETYGGPNTETAWSVDAVNDSGFIIAGVGTSGIPPTQTSWFSLVRIDENGDTLWTRAISGATIESPACIRSTHDGGFAFVGTTFIADRQDEALLVKTDRWGETQWQHSFGGPIDDNAWSLQQCADGGYAFAGMVCENTYDAYLVKTDESGLLVSVNPPIGVSEVFHLAQNYPNPFNPGTTICYQLPERSHVMLKVYDVVGREVATLVNEVKQPGTYTAEFDGSTVSSGVYLYRLSVGNNSSVRKMLVIR